MSKVNHGDCAIHTRLMSSAYSGTVPRRGGGEEWTVIEAATYLDLPPLLARYGEWAVCNRGVERLTHSYSISSDRLDEQDWESHLEEKAGVDMSDFTAALELARSFKRLGYIR